MKFSETWLREWINPKISRDELCEKLTMAGLEIEEQGPVAPTFTNVVIAEILKVDKLPDSDRLHICEVNIGKSQPVTIVCGAPNVKAGMKVPAALEGAELPHDLKIKKTEIRGATSNGMLCSAKELGLSDDSAGLYQFPENAPVGKDIREYLQLEDHFIDVSITPNRGDCLSIRGIAKEVSALTGVPVISHKTPEIISAIKDVIPVTVEAGEECPRYVGRVIRGVKADAASPVWLQERLRRSGLRSIHPIVDVTNFVMLELGQPMHAFSLDKIKEGINVRLSKKDEKITLLDGNEIELDKSTLVIADAKKPLAIAGIMGGLESGVTLLSQDIFLESAYFKASSLAAASRHYKLSSDSAYRFERGVDPTIQKRAIERATQLLLDIVGGNPGPVIEVSNEIHLPQAASIKLRSERVKNILGFDVGISTIENILESLGFVVDRVNEGWQVTVPARRSDITIEVDLIEEIARLYGYDKIPCHSPKATLQIVSATENKIPLQAFRSALSELGYHEVVTYSFIDKKIQNLFDPNLKPKELLNPITAEMSVMRTSLWPGLVNTLQYNQNRQQNRVRLFETGLRFIVEGNALKQERMLAGLISGPQNDLQWGIKARNSDFFDLKGDLQNLFKITHAENEFTFEPSTHDALHPGQTAKIYRNGEYVGIIGALHPKILQSLKIEDQIFAFELLIDQIETGSIPTYENLSKFPEIRRDIALLVNQAVLVQAIEDSIKTDAGELLKEIRVFDLYQGKGIQPGYKSIALSLTLQHSSRTLIDEEVANLMDRVIAGLKGKFNAELRG